jgi:hypothetical protein
VLQVAIHRRFPMLGLACEMLCETFDGGIELRDSSAGPHSASAASTGAWSMMVILLTAAAASLREAGTVSASNARTTAHDQNDVVA